MILLDTHSLIWHDLALPRIGKTTHFMIEEAWAESEVYVSAISFWEVALLNSKSRVALRVPPNQWRLDLLAAGYQEIALDGATAIASVQLDLDLKDPADRLIAATALAYDATLITADDRLLAWPGALKRQDARL